MKMTTAQGYVDRLGPKFKAAIIDRTFNLRVIADRYQMSTATAWGIRQLFTGAPVRNHNRHLEITPKMIALFKSSLTSREIAEQIGLTHNQVSHHRSKYRPKTKIKSLRYDGPTVALLKSDLPAKDIARALNVELPAVYRNRNAILKRETNYQYRPLTAELTAKIYSYPDPQTASLETGVGLYTVRALFVRRRILAGEAKGITRRTNNSSKFPTDPTWWEARTQKEIMKEIKVSQSAIWYHALTRGYTYKGMQKIEA